MDATRSNGLPPGARGIPKAASERLLPNPLYKHGHVSVTREWLVINGYHYPVIELAELHTVRGARHPLIVRTMVITMVIFLALAAALGLAGSSVDISGWTYVALGAAFTVPAALAVVGEWIRPRAWELRANYYGITARLFSTNSEREYRDVTQALTNAIATTRPVSAGRRYDVGPGNVFRTTSRSL